MGTRVIIPPKYQGDTINQAFNFISNLGVTESISSAVCTCTVYSGTDPSPSSVINGAAVVSSLTIATQSLKGGVLGVIYELLMTVVTSLGQTLSQSGYLVIVPDLP